MSIRLRFAGGTRAGDDLVFDDAVDRISIGRDPARCDVVFPRDERAVGREHCALERVLGRYRLVLNERNRVYVDDRPAVSGEELPTRAVLRLGREGPELEATTVAAHLPSTLRDPSTSRDSSSRDSMSRDSMSRDSMSRHSGGERAGRPGTAGASGGVPHEDPAGSRLAGNVLAWGRVRRKRNLAIAVTVGLAVLATALIIGGGKPLDEAGAGLASINARDRGVGWVTPTADPQDFDPNAIYDRRHALIIGIDAYSDDRIERLDHAVDDARAVAALLQQHFGYTSDSITSLYNEDATRKSILRAMANLADDIDKDDSFLLFWAGHAIQASDARDDDHGYLIPYDGSKDESLRTVMNIPMSSLQRDSLPFIMAKHKLVIVDTCFSGLMRKMRSTVDRDSVTPAYLRAIARKPVTYVITAGDSGQRVLDSSIGAGGHSAFTAHLIDMLTNDVPAYVTASDLGPELRRRVSLDADRQGYVQTPLYGVVDGEGDFIFVRDKEDGP